LEFLSVIALHFIKGNQQHPHYCWDKQYHRIPVSIASFAAHNKNREIAPVIRAQA